MPTWLRRKTDGFMLHGKDKLIRLYQQRSINHGPLSASISRASLRLTNHEVRSRNTSILRTEDEAAAGDDGWRLFRNLYSPENIRLYASSERRNSGIEVLLQYV